VVITCLDQRYIGKNIFDVTGYAAAGLAP